MPSLDIIQVTPTYFLSSLLTIYTCTLSILDTSLLNKLIMISSILVLLNTMLILPDDNTKTLSPCFVSIYATKLHTSTSKYLESSALHSLVLSEIRVSIIIIINLLFMMIKTIRNRKFLYFYFILCK